MNYTIYLGLTAGFLTTIAFLPQVVKSWKSKQTKDISLLMFSFSVSGFFLWLVYGILIKNLPLIIANLLTFIFAASILVLKIKYK